MANLKGLLSQFAGGRRGAAGGRPAGGGARGGLGGSRGRAGGTKGQDEAIGRGIRKLVARGRR
jgi:hypothetical protein